MTMVPAYAFFDVDQTLLSIKSMVSFQNYWFDVTGHSAARQIFDDEMTRLRNAAAPREVLNRRYYAHFAARAVSDVEECAVDWFNHLAATTPRLFHAPVVDALQRHQDDGTEPVLVSGSFPALLTPVARRLGVRHILATQMVVAHGRYTGEILLPQTIGNGKAEAIARFLEASCVPARDCFGYGDDISDLPMLATVGHPVVVRGCASLETEAIARGWPLISP